MSILVLTSDTLIGTPATGNLEYNGQFFGTDSNASRAQLQRITQGTAVTASGTSVDFTGLPAWCKKITVMFSGVSTNGTSGILIQIGTSSGIQNTGYNSIVFAVTSAVASSAANTTTGFGTISSGSASSSYHGSLILTAIGDASSTWTGIGNFGDSVATVRGVFLAGSKSLSGTLDRIRLTTGNGTDAFDAGSINILYEG